MAPAHPHPTPARLQQLKKEAVLIQPHTYLRWFQRCNDRHTSGWVPLLIAGAAVGLVRPALAARLVNTPGALSRQDDTLVLDPALTCAEARTAALAAQISAVAATGALPPPRGERCRIDGGWGTPVLAELDRAYLAHLGMRGYGVHVNGVTALPDGTPALWIARRALDRATEPGKLDNVVAGGLPAGISLMDNVMKEAAEEAGMPASLAGQAASKGQLSYAYEIPAGLLVDTLFLFDLAVPGDFTPHNHDGEVAGFERLPLAEVARLVRDTDHIKRNCNLVMLDYLYRQQALDLSADGMGLIAVALREAAAPT